MSREFTTAAVIGLGTMGAGLTEVLARHGLKVVTVEVDQAASDRGRARIEASVERAVSRDKLSPQDAESLLARITYATELEPVAPADLVVEAVPERLELKKEIFGKLDAICSPDAILATNTSSLPVTDISVATEHPRRVIGLHFFNPAPVQKLVEVIRTVVTDQGVVDDAVAFTREVLGKTPVVVGDRAGFIANTLLMGYLNHAVSMLESRYATREDIDASMIFGCGLPMGPLSVIDLIGLDTVYEVLDTMYHQGRDRLHAPSPILKQMVTAGLLGRKSGRGFYTYAKPGSSTVVPDAATPAARAGGQSVRPVSSVGVIGSGTMASGIVEVLAKAGLDVIFVARSEAKVEQVVAKVTKSLDRAVGRGKLDQASRDAALGRVTGATSVGSLGQVDLVVEAIVEDLEVKRALFAELDGICKPGAILATTTSSLPVIECGAATSRPQDVVGMHFFNPAPVMKLVEVVHTVATAPDVVDTVVEVCGRIGKHPVICGDRAGFIVNALLFPYLNDAVRMLSEHYATADEIDVAMKNGCGYPMGPFELLDVVGLDVSLAIQRTLYLEFRERGWAPTPLLEQMVRAGYLGRKTGRGFRIYG
ncbi:MAG: hypothetical protein JNL54_02810 [Kineosporiaceae bacterium]|nr:hypothetical protein [Kineosporiaceae bacterium]